jgi:hypothetical protein
VSGDVTGPPSETLGVSLEQYAAIQAHLGEGHDIALALEHEHVAPEAWEEAESTWAFRLADDLDRGGPLQARYDAALSEAQSRLGRPLPPLDAELGPYLDLVRAFGAAEDPLAFLASLGLRGADLTRLHQQWSRRLADEPALRAEARELLDAPPGPVPRLVAAPPTQAKPKDRAPATPPEPVVDAEDTPPLFGSLPVEGDIAPVTAPRAADQEDTIPAVPFTRAPLPFAAPPPLPAVHKAPAALVATMGSIESPIKSALPFAGRVEAPKEPVVANEVKAALGSTVSLDASALLRQALPFAKGPVASGTPKPEPAPTRAAEMGRALLAQPSPLGGEMGRTVLAPSPLMGDEERTAPPQRSPLRPALPFAQAGAGQAPKAEAPPPLAALRIEGLTLAQYAAIGVALGRSEEEAEALFRRFGLPDMPSRVRADAAWRERVRRDPAAAQELQRIMQAMRERR